MPFDFREDLVENFKITIKYISMVNVVLSCLLDIAIYKKRSLVDFIFYIEMVHTTLLFLIPSANNNYTDLYISLMNYFFFTAFYTGKGGQICITLISDAVQRFVILPLIFKKTLTFGAILSKLSLSIALFLICLSLSVILRYTSDLHSRMKASNSENIRLLDGMHEGLLILDKAKKGIMFFNRPAQKLFSGAISKLKTQYTKDGQIVNSLLDPKIFQPVKIGVKDELKKFQQMVNEGD